jgi:hypothetical protein
MFVRYENRIQFSICFVSFRSSLSCWLQWHWPMFPEKSRIDRDASPNGGTLVDGRGFDWPAGHGNCLLVFHAAGEQILASKHESRRFWRGFLFHSQPGSGKSA